MEQFEGQTIETVVETPKRPTFLTVICIITWVGCAWAIIGGIIGYFTSQSSYAQMEQMSDFYNSNPLMSDAMESARLAAENAGVIALIRVLGGILCLVGSLMMWNLKKPGFYLYTVAEIAPVISAFLYSGSGVLGIVVASGVAVISLVWIIMYAVNLKHMK